MRRMAFASAVRSGAGEMGSNGTVEERLARAEAARVVLGAAWREVSVARSRN